MTSQLQALEQKQQEIDANQNVTLLGSFWTRVFRDQPLLEGYVSGVVNEVLDRYQDAINVLNEQSLATCPVTDHVNWQPLTIYRSKVNRLSALISSDSGQLIGVQTSDTLVQGAEYGKFYLGVGESSVAFDGWAIQDPGIGVISELTDNVLTSSQVLDMEGKQRNGFLFFNEDPFETFSSSVTHVLNSTGKVVDEVLLLWSPGFGHDVRRLQRVYGRLLGWSGPSNTAYHELLKAILSIRVKGATPDQLAGLLAAAAPNQTVNYEDYLSSGDWWTTIPALQIPAAMLPAGFKHTVAFKNTLQEVSYQNGVLLIPITASVQDTARWLSWTNDPSVLPTLLSQFDLSEEKQTVRVNLVDLFMQNLFGASTALSSVTGQTLAEAQTLGGVISACSRNLPAHVWLICSVQSEVPQDEVQVAEASSGSWWPDQNAPQSQNRLFSFSSQETQANWNTDNSFILWKTPPSKIQDTVSSPAKDGRIFTKIPPQLNGSAQVSTKDIQTLSLIDFS